MRPCNSCVKHVTPALRRGLHKPACAQRSFPSRECPTVWKTGVLVTRLARTAAPLSEYPEACSAPLSEIRPRGCRTTARQYLPTGIADLAGPAQILHGRHTRPNLAHRTHRSPPRDCLRSLAEGLLSVSDVQCIEKRFSVSSPLRHASAWPRHSGGQTRARSHRLHKPRQSGKLPASLVPCPAPCPAASPEMHAALT